MSPKRSFLPRRIIHCAAESRKQSKSHNLHASRNGIIPHIVDSLGKGHRDENGGDNNNNNDDNCCDSGRGRVQGDVVVSSGKLLRGDEPDRWAGMLPELLGEIMRRVEAGEEESPHRQNIVACAGVCKRWRKAAKEVADKATIDHPGVITFPSSLKKVIYNSFVTASTGKDKFLLAAQRCRKGGRTEYILSLDEDDLSSGCKSYVGKLRSDFLGTNYKIYDIEAPHSGAKPSCSKNGRRIGCKQISPQVLAGNFEVGTVSYKFNLLKLRGPRRMACRVSCSAPNEDELRRKDQETSAPVFTVLKNKAPRWHDNLECWCLNFHGRVTVASVKNFQMVARVDQSRPDGKGDEETVLLQFGKVGDDSFSMDYRRPLSAFQAFAICLTSFGTKLACE